MSIKRTIAAVVLASAVAVPVVALSAAAGASVVPANFPGNNGISCNAWHGAPGGFGPDSPFYTVAGPQGGLGGYAFGQAQGVTTGQNNSNYSAGCN